MQDVEALVLTPESLRRAIEVVAEETDEAKCAAALVSAATLVQQAVLSDQPADSFCDAMESVPDGYGFYLREVCNRAIDFHPQYDKRGGQLGFWLVPVLLDSDLPLGPVLHLEADPRKSLRLENALMRQFGMLVDTTAPIDLDKPLGTTSLMPVLYSADALNKADFAELVKLPHQVRDVKSGELKRVNFKSGEEARPATGEALLYFLPVVVYHPPGAPIDVPAASEDLAERLGAWIEASVPEASVEENEFAVQVCLQPHPFTTAQLVGKRMRNEAQMHGVISQIVAKSSVSPNGMAALIALYAPQQSDDLVLGVSLTSRLTGAAIATLNMRVESDDGSEEVALATYMLSSLGMTCVQRRDEPVDTIICQHCGGMQFLLPNPAIAQHGVEPDRSTRH